MTFAAMKKPGKNSLIEEIEIYPNPHWPTFGLSVQTLTTKTFPFALLRLYPISKQNFEKNPVLYLDSKYWMLMRTKLYPTKNAEKHIYE